MCSKIFLPPLVVTSKHKRRYSSQTYSIASIILSSSTNIFIRQPNNSDMTWDRYVAPFSYGLWLAVAITACALGACLALTNYGHQSNQNRAVSAMFFYIYACFCRQGQSYKYRCTFLNFTVFNPVS
jgi:hypothetical protein